MTEYDSMDASELETSLTDIIADEELTEEELAQANKIIKRISGYYIRKSEVARSKQKQKEKRRKANAVAKKARKVK